MLAKNNYPKHPLYIVSKGRHEYMMTSKALTKMGIHHFIVVEPQQVKDYQNAINKMKLLTTVVELDLEYKNKYELCDDLGLTKSTGPGPARNFAWEHSKKNGHTHHWVMDDNIRSFQRLQNNFKIRCYTSAPFRAMEDFTKKYLNVAMSGPNYTMFAPRKKNQPPFVLNTRIYSCNFIKNDLPFRWRGRYNEDTILSLDMLTAGWATIQFNAFLQEKMPTQKMSGGNSSDFYFVEGKKIAGKDYTDTGTLEKSKMLAKVYPEIAEVVYKFNRIHHTVDYSKFKSIKLIKDPNWIPPVDPNYGMKLESVK